MSGFENTHTIATPVLARAHKLNAISEEMPDTLCPFQRNISIDMPGDLKNLSHLETSATT